MAHLLNAVDVMSIKNEYCLLLKNVNANQGTLPTVISMPAPKFVGMAKSMIKTSVMMGILSAGMDVHRLVLYRMILIVIIQSNQVYVCTDCLILSY